MDGDCSRRGIVCGENSYGGFEFQGSHMRDLQHHQVPRQDSTLPFTMMIPNQPSVHHNSLVTEYNNGDADHNEPNKSKNNSPWQRVKWIDKMVKLMITALSYLVDDVKHKQGKWKSVSKVMDERGYHVSPQQCEDKFNDLYKRYKKLNEMLGRGISCNIVENPSLLDKIDYLDDKEKDEVRKIMRTKHLCYEEMCSYHNGNRLHLPHDPALQRSLHLILRSRDGHDNDEDLDGGGGHHGASLDGPLKRIRRSQSHEDLGHPNHMDFQPCNEWYVPQLPLSQANVNRRMSLESGKAPSLQKQWVESKSFGLEEQKIQIQAELMEVERQRIKWERFSQKKDQELETMRMENELMKLENERMTLELRRFELGAKNEE